MIPSSRRPSAVTSAVRLSFLPPQPSSSWLDFMKRKTQGQLLMTPDISLSSRMPVIYTETRWPATQVTKLGSLRLLEKSLSLLIPRATNMSVYWKPIGLASWVFLKKGAPRLATGYMLRYSPSMVFIILFTLNLLESGSKKWLKKKNLSESQPECSKCGRSWVSKLVALATYR